MSEDINKVIRKAQLLGIKTPALEHVSTETLKGSQITREALKTRIGWYEELRSMLVRGQPRYAFQRFEELRNTTGVTVEEALEDANYIISYYTEMLENLE